MKPVRVSATFEKVDEGWHGQHHRRVAHLAADAGSPFVEGKLVLDVEPFVGLPVGSRVEIEITPVGVAPEQPQA